MSTFFAWAWKFRVLVWQSNLPTASASGARHTHTHHGRDAEVWAKSDQLGRVDELTLREGKAGTLLMIPCMRKAVFITSTWRWRAAREGIFGETLALGRSLKTKSE